MSTPNNKPKADDEEEFVDFDEEDDSFTMDDIEAFETIDELLAAADSKPKQMNPGDVGREGDPFDDGEKEEGNAGAFTDFIATMRNRLASSAPRAGALGANRRGTMRGKLKSVVRGVVWTRQLSNASSRKNSMHGEMSTSAAGSASPSKAAKDAMTRLHQTQEIGPDGNPVVPSTREDIVRLLGTLMVVAAKTKHAPPEFVPNHGWELMMALLKKYSTDVEISLLVLAVLTSAIHGSGTAGEKGPPPEYLCTLTYWALNTEDPKLTAFVDVLADACFYCAPLMAITTMPESGLVSPGLSSLPPAAGSYSKIGHPLSPMEMKGMTLPTILANNMERIVSRSNGKNCKIWPPLVRLIDALCRIEVGLSSHQVLELWNTVGLMLSANVIKALNVDHRADTVLGVARLMDTVSTRCETEDANSSAMGAAVSMSMTVPCPGYPLIGALLFCLGDDDADSRGGAMELLSRFHSEGDTKLVECRVVKALTTAPPLVSSFASMGLSGGAQGIMSMSMVRPMLSPRPATESNLTTPVVNPRVRSDSMQSMQSIVSDTSRSTGGGALPLDGAAVMKKALSAMRFPISRHVVTSVVLKSIMTVLRTPGKLQGVASDELPTVDGMELSGMLEELVVALSEAVLGAGSIPEDDTVLLMEVTAAVLIHGSKLSSNGSPIVSVNVTSPLSPNAAPAPSLQGFSSIKAVSFSQLVDSCLRLVSAPWCNPSPTSPTSLLALSLLGIIGNRSASWISLLNNDVKKFVDVIIGHALFLYEVPDEPNAENIVTVSVMASKLLFSAVFGTDGATGSPNMEVLAVLKETGCAGYLTSILLDGFSNRSPAGTSTDTSSGHHHQAMNHPAFSAAYATLATLKANSSGSTGRKGGGVKFSEPSSPLPNGNDSTLIPFSDLDGPNAGTGSNHATHRGRGSIQFLSEAFFQPPAALTNRIGVTSPPGSPLLSPNESISATSSPFAPAPRSSKVPAVIQRWLLRVLSQFDRRFDPTATTTTTTTSETPNREASGTQRNAAADEVEGLIHLLAANATLLPEVCAVAFRRIPPSTLLASKFIERVLNALCGPTTPTPDALDVGLRFLVSYHTPEWLKGLQHAKVGAKLLLLWVSRAPQEGAKGKAEESSTAFWMAALFSQTETVDSPLVKAGSVVPLFDAAKLQNVDKLVEEGHSSTQLLLAPPTRAAVDQCASDISKFSAALNAAMQQQTPPAPSAAPAPTPAASEKKQDTPSSSTVAPTSATPAVSPGPPFSVQVERLGAMETQERSIVLWSFQTSALSMQAMAVQEAKTLFKLQEAKTAIEAQQKDITKHLQRIKVLEKAPRPTLVALGDAPSPSVNFGAQEEEAAPQQPQRMASPGMRRSTKVFQQNDDTMLFDIALRQWLDWRSESSDLMDGYYKQKDQMLWKVIDQQLRRQAMGDHSAKVLGSERSGAAFSLQGSGEDPSGTGPGTPKGQNVSLAPPAVPPHMYTPQYQQQQAARMRQLETQIQEQQDAFASYMELAEKECDAAAAQMEEAQAEASRLRRVQDEHAALQEKFKALEASYKKVCAFSTTSKLSKMQAAAAAPGARPISSVPGQRSTVANTDASGTGVSGGPSITTTGAASGGSLEQRQQRRIRDLEKEVIRMEQELLNAAIESAERNREAKAKLVALQMEMPPAAQRGGGGGAAGGGANSGNNGAMGSILWMKQRCKRLEESLSRVKESAAASVARASRNQQALEASAATEMGRLHAEIVKKDQVIEELRSGNPSSLTGAPAATGTPLRDVKLGVRPSSGVRPSLKPAATAAVVTSQLRSALQPIGGPTPQPSARPSSVAGTREDSSSGAQGRKAFRSLPPRGSVVASQESAESNPNRTSSSLTPGARPLNPGVVSFETSRPQSAFA